jgi:trans-aconitate 2-methyltransferase
MSLTWSGDHYADHTAHHRAYDEVLLGRLTALPADGVLVDVGCGVGDFTRGLLARVPHGRVIGVDADPSMIATAQKQHHDVAALTFDVLPAQELGRLDAVAPGSVDAIVSTACLHWVSKLDHSAVLSGARRVLRPGGQWCVEFGGAGQLAALRVVLDPLAREFGGGAPPWFFPTADEYAALLESAGFVDIEVELVRQTRAMADAVALRGLLTSQVLVAYLTSIAPDRHAEFTDRACESVVALAEGSQPPNYDVEYVRVLACAVNPS